MAKITISDKLRMVKAFQDKYPDSHLGGSIGLLLHGIDLKRSYDKSDIDMTVLNTIPPTDALIENFIESSNPDDFDYAYRAFPNNGSAYVKVDVKIWPEMCFSVINHEGIDYNVSNKEYILLWKQKYADKGVTKHINDMIVINGGERPVEKETAPAIIDDLPF